MSDEFRVPSCRSKVLRQWHGEVHTGEHLMNSSMVNQRFEGPGEKVPIHSGM